MRKKFLSVFLILAMLLSMLPVTALAAALPAKGADGVIRLNVKNQSYTITSELTDPIEVSATGVTLVVNAPMTAVDGSGPVITVTNTGSLTIQGSGMIRAEGTAIANAGSLTIQSSGVISAGDTAITNSNSLEIKSSGKIETTGNGYAIDNQGVLKITGEISVGGTPGTSSRILSSGASAGLYILPGGAIADSTGAGYVPAVEIKSGTASVTGGGISGPSGIKVSGGTLTVSGGTITASEKGVEVSDGGTLYVQGSAKIKDAISGVAVSGGNAYIQGGEISGSDKGVEVSGGTLRVVDGAVITGVHTGISVSGGSLTVEGGEISGGTDALSISGGAGTAGTPKIGAGVTGGTFRGNISASGTDPDRFISGGRFSSSNVSSYLVDGLEPAGPTDGLYQIIEAGSTSPSGRKFQAGNSKYYTTIDAAVAATSSNGMVTIVGLADGEAGKEAGNLNIGKTITIDLNGYPLISGGAIIVGKNGVLTITDGKKSKNVYVIGSGSQTIVVEEGGVLNVNGAAVRSSGESYGEKAAAIWAENGTVNIDGGTVTATEEYGGVGVSITQGSFLTISNGGAVTAVGAGGVGVSIGQNSELTMSGAGNTVTADGNDGIGVRVTQGGTLSVTGSTISAANGCAIFHSGGETKVDNGTITGQAGIVARTGTVEVNGATVQASGTQNMNIEGVTVYPSGIVYNESYESQFGGVTIAGGQVLAAAGQAAVRYAHEDNYDAALSTKAYIDITGGGGANSTGVFSSSVSEFVDPDDYQFEARYKDEDGYRYCYYKDFNNAVTAVAPSGIDGAVTSLNTESRAYNVRFYLNEPNSSTSGTPVGVLYAHNGTTYYVDANTKSQMSGGWPADPAELLGYTFDGWFTTTNRVSGGTNIIQNGPVPDGTEGKTLGDFLADPKTATDFPLYTRWTTKGLFIVGATHHKTLKAAVEAAENTSHRVEISTINGYVTLNDQEIPERIGADIVIKDPEVAFELNLGGKTLPFDSSHGLVIEASSAAGGGDAPTVTIANGTIDGADTAVETSGPVNVIVDRVVIKDCSLYGIDISAGTLDVRSGVKMTDYSGSSAGIYVRGGEAAVRSGAEIAGNVGALVDSGKLTVEGGAKLTGANAGIQVNNGTLTVESGARITGTSNGIQFDNGTLTVKNGAGITGGEHGVCINGGNLTIEGGEISGGGYALYFAGTSYGTVAVTGGTFRGGGADGECASVYTAWGPEHFISGGTFLNKDNKKDPLPDEYLAIGAMQDEKGTVISPDAVATITFHANGGYFEDDIDAASGDTATRKTLKNTTLPEDQRPKVSRDKDFFLGWYTVGEDAELVDSAYKFTEDTDLYAHWGYTITFDTNYVTGEDGESLKITAVTDDKGKLAKWPDDPTREDFTFAGWYTEFVEGEPLESDHLFTESTTVYAHWGFEITFDAKGGKIGGEPTVTLMTTEEGWLVDEVPEPDARTGFDFDGWYKVNEDTELEELFDFENHPFTGNTYLSAHWTRDANSSIYIITFDANGGTFKDGDDPITMDTDEEGKLTALPEQPTYAGHTFNGWYEVDGDTKLVVPHTFTKDTVLKANWTKNDDPVYTITLDANGGTFEGGGKTAAKQTDVYGLLKDTDLSVKPTQDGYTFVDWYTKADGGDKVTSAYKFTKDTTIYAQWKKDSSGGSSGDDGSGDTSGTYSIKISDTRHGTVSASRLSAKSGDIVRLTVKPETDYIVDSITVTPASGTSPTLSQSGNVYSFVMPAANVTVSAKFSLRAEYNTFIPPQTQTNTSTGTGTGTGSHGSLPPSAFTPITWRPAVTMRDVPTSSWAYPAAQWAYQNGYLDTAADGSFRLNDTVSHMQLWRIMAQWMGESALDDNSVSLWARKSGAARIDNSSSSTMTRQNMVEYLYQCYFLMGGDVSVSGNLIQYRDGQQVTSGSAKNAWLWAVSKGIINGSSDGYLNPNKVLTRAEFASILMRLCQNG